MHKSVFTICAHEGFDGELSASKILRYHHIKNQLFSMLGTSESILSVLVDVADEMLTKYCNLLKVNTERELVGHSSGFTVPIANLTANLYLTSNEYCFCSY